MGTNHGDKRYRFSENAKKIEQENRASNQTGQIESTIMKNNTSMSSLIVWNISKALERKPCMDLKSGIRMAQERLQHVTREGNTVISQYPEEEHLVCALLAWQQLGHAHADSLYELKCLCLDCAWFTDIVSVPVGTPNSLVIQAIGDSSKTRVGCAWFTDIFLVPVGTPNSLVIQALADFSKTGVDTFIMSKKIENANNASNFTDKKQQKTLIVTSNSITVRQSQSSSSREIDSLCFGAYSNGPVIKLPVETKLIMRLDQPGTPGPVKKCTKCKRQASEESKNSVQSSQGSVEIMMPESGSCCGKPGSQRSPSPASTNTERKLNAACCLDSMCADKLAKMDADTEELRSRAQKLAKREAQRAELLERAEAAWKDLERGYQRRLTLAQEKEEDITRQIQKMIDDRNTYKNTCNNLAKDLKDRGNAAEEVRVILKNVEAEVCQLACQRLKLSEEATRAEAALAEQQCKTVQHQRDLQFKEEQVRRKVLTMESEIESACALTHETERALRAELSGLREQITDVSNQLLEEDDENKRLKLELEELRQEKMGMIEDLEGCKMQCDNNIKKQLDELQELRKKLATLKEKELECKCQLPVDKAIEVKRTPSLAALCKCSPEDRIMDSCSCTSMKGRLLSNLLADLFGGLQSELGGTGSQMPCQLLKCLEDQHNWDRASVTKSNLRNYFSNLLVGELDIAIATSIENYHAKWVGTTCADSNSRMTPGPDDDLNEGWEKRAIERQAQKLAAQLAEELFEQRAEELTKRAKEIVTSGPPPCACKKRSSQNIYPCILEPVTPFRTKSPDVVRTSKSTEASRKGSQFDKVQSPPQFSYWKQTHQDVTQLRQEIEVLRKETIKKEDLKMMEEKITKIVQKTTGSENEDIITKDNSSYQTQYKQEIKNIRNSNTDVFKNTLYKAGLNKKKTFDIGVNNLNKKSFLQEKPTKQPKKYSYHQTYAVNMCLCATQKPNKIIRNNPINFDVKAGKPRPSKDLSDNKKKLSTDSTESYCNSDCKCLHRIPSNTSIDKLLETLSKWKSDLGGDSQDKFIKNGTNIHKHSKSILKNKSYIDPKAVSLVTDGDKASEMQNLNSDVDKQNFYTNFSNVIKTASEYMADINVDKTNECASHQAGTIELNKENEQQELNFINDCLDPLTCVSNKQTDQHSLVQSENPKLKNILAQNLDKKINDAAAINIFTNSKSTRAIDMDNNRNETESQEENITHKKSTNPADLVQNLDYYIKFLGVTLVDKSEKATNSLCNNKLPLNPQCYKNSHKKGPIPVSPKSSSDSSKRCATIVIDSSKKQKKCECNAKFEEFKNFIMGIFNDQVKEKKTGHKDIALDSQNFSRTLDSCICCNTKHLDGSKDLEVNAFDLLEAHLKEKIKEFKICSCQSTCISTEEEEKIYRTILERVKEVISDCANELRCRVSENFIGSEGSWQRAYGLLREYLRMKVKRAQCLADLNDDKDEVLPNIMQKVCNLIENDFQRLQNMCKCEKKDKLLSKITFKEPLPELNCESPEKDLRKSITANDRGISIKPKILTQNMLSQVHSNVRMETKSCDAMVNNLNIVNAVSTQYLSKPITQSISSQIPIDLGMSAKFYNEILDVNDIVKTVSKENITGSVFLSSQQSAYSQIPIDLGMETKSCDAMIKADNIVKIVSRLNLTNTNSLSQQMSCQVPPNLGMENKYCDVMININGVAAKLSSENLTECKLIPSHALSQKRHEPNIKTQSCDVMEVNVNETNDLVYNTCNCNYGHLKSTFQDFGSKKLLYNIHTNINNSSKLEKCVHWTPPNVLENTKSLPNLETIETTKSLHNLAGMEINNNVINNDSKTRNEYGLKSNIPYIGTTIDCICDSSFKSCSCIKSLIKDNISTQSYDWKQLLADNNKHVQNFSYIMNGKQNNNIACEMLSNFTTSVEKTFSNNTCQSEDVLLLHSKKIHEPVHHGTNTSEIKSASGCIGSFNWFLSPQPVKSQRKLKVIAVKASNCSFYYEPVEDSIPSCKSISVTESKPSTDKLNDSLYYDPIIVSTYSGKSMTTLDTISSIIKPTNNNNCNCDKVPICHVKMLVENIERNLIESNCTCDAVSKICPIHSKALR